MHSKFPPFALPLLSLNLGIELGKLLVAALLEPLICMFRGRPGFAKRWVPAGSIVAALAGVFWLIQPGCRINWRFNIEDARVKLKKLYPSFND